MNFQPISSEEISALGALCRNSKRLRAEQVLVHEGCRTDMVYLILNGMAARYKLLPNGRRQILGFLVPGDVCDLQFLDMGKTDHSVGLLSDSEIVRIPLQTFRNLIQSFPGIAKTMSIAAMIEVASLREWLLNMGQREALQRLSHLFCELSLRMKAVAQVDEDGSFFMPINQATLADTTGLTAVHINRTLQRLRAEGLIRLRQRKLTLLQPERLAAIADFDESYLRANCERRNADGRSPQAVVSAVPAPALADAEATAQVADV
jgi:CRP-like cAMP-binding protein